MTVQHGPSANNCSTNEFTRQTKILTKTCNNFSNVIPLHIYPQHPQTEDPIISYTGINPPQDRMQHCAKALYHFIRGTNPAEGRTRMI